jgi:error-prone DNA polymerase
VRCRWEEREGGGGGGGGGGGSAVRLGLKFVRGLRREAAAGNEREQGVRPFADIDDLARRARLRDGELAALAACGALAGFGLTRRGALWQAARAGRPAGPLLADLPDETPSPLVEMADVEETLADYAHTGLTAGVHPLRYLRPTLARRGVVPAAELGRLADGQRVRTAGSVIVRQRPGTAAGLLFMTLEDETGMSQAIVTPDVLEDFRPLVVSRPGVVVEGTLQKRDGTLSVKAERFWPLAGIEALEEVRSYDFR